MKPVFALAALALLATPIAASAQEREHTPEDDIAMTRCVELARAATNADDQPQDLKASPAAPLGLADCIGAASGPCMETPDGMTTIGMTECMMREANWWDTLLNTHYQSLRQSLDAESFTVLRDAQRAWIAYSESNCLFQYTYWRDGTIRSTFHSSCVLDMTARRAIELEQFAAWSH